jgi:hypothetical protein
MIALTIALFLLLGAGPVQAENDDLEEGIRLYEALEYEPAQAMLEAALTHEGSSREEIARAALYLGVVRVALGDVDAGSTWFTVALSYDATVQVPAGTSPKIREQFEALAARLTFTRPTMQAAPVQNNTIEKPNTPAIDALVSGPAVVEEHSMMWTYVAGGSAILAASAALTFGVMAYTKANEIESGPHERAQLLALQDQVDFRGRVANGFLAAAGALTATTIVVYLVQRPGKQTLETPAISVSGSADGAMAGTWFRF